MPGAAYPKPDDAKVTRVEPKYGWTDLPKTNTGPVPALPPIREWTAETLRWWAVLWSKPQASQWDQSGESAVPMAVLYDQLQDAPEQAPKILAEMRQHEDRHGLNPKAMLQLRWRITVEETKPAAPKSAKRGRRAAVLALVPSSDAAS